MIGPNGCGKSSVFDASALNKGARMVDFLSCLNRFLSILNLDLSETDFQGTRGRILYRRTQITQEDVWKKSVHIRTAYRNDAMGHLVETDFPSKTNRSDNRRK